jgi:cell division protein FtsB
MVRVIKDTSLPEDIRRGTYSKKLLLSKVQFAYIRKVAHARKPHEIGQVRRVLADMHVAPAWRRWATRAALAVAVAAAIAIAPTLIDRGDERADKLKLQLRDTEQKIRAVERENAALLDDINGLRDDVGAIERQARDELGMVYPGELVIQLDEP